MLTETVPDWVADLALPIGFGADRGAPRVARVAGTGSAAPLRARSASSRGILLTYNRAALSGQALLPWLALVLLAGALGAPIFALLGGIALFASLTRGNPPVVLPMMAYQELTTSTGVAAIPLFTLAGFLLAEGQSSERLLRVVPRLVRLGAGRHRHRRGDAVRVLHAVHRRIGRHHPRPRRTAAAGARRQTAIASASRSACSPRRARSGCSFRCRCR